MMGIGTPNSQNSTPRPNPMSASMIGALPTWGYSGSWGYGPGGIVGVLLIIVIVLALTGRI
jgi:hypothetical protein